ncbi:DUF423 domain-containing protein [Phenylobacterium sp.]|uniref:DUF423 domain-containing protein n=1 Tax=Phenylobacterium sp. TaxID=1871053 RepID=UPI002735077A|nr:DUF423 domain-containing protein [Phenylobacterium sp.]MDP3660130.1 DUF423 domain-containing protein [Phenylobacterium sp.]
MSLAAAVGFLSVAFGAFAAHGVPDPYAKGLLEIGSRYAFMHALATVACAVFMQLGAARARHAPALFLPGVMIFSGSLVAMAFGAPRWLGAITPLGGLLFLGGWAVLAWSAAAIDRPRA